MSKKNEFAKLYWHNDHQVLILKDFDHEDEMYITRVSTYHNGVEIAFSLRFKSEDSCDKTFDAIDEEKAGKELMKLLKDFDFIYE